MNKVLLKLSFLVLGNEQSLVTKLVAALGYKFTQYPFIGGEF